MDLNLTSADSSLTGACWLPRGAMDLNSQYSYQKNTFYRWLPRGAMDLNTNRPCAIYPIRVGSLVEPWI